MFNSLKFKISASLFILVILILTLVLWQSLKISFHQNEKDNENLKHITVTLLEQTARAALFTEAYDTIQFRIDSIMDEPHIKNISLSDNRDIVVASNQFDQLGRPFYSSSLPNTEKLDIIEIGNITGRLGVLFVEYSELDFELINRGIVLNASIMAILGTLVVAGLSLIVGQLLTRRLNIVTKTAQGIASGQFDSRTYLAGKDEISELGLTFDKMADYIDDRQKKLTELNLHLEQRVEARTEDYQKANKELEAFCYSVSHDLRAPLRAIDGFSLVLSEDYSDVLDENGRNYIDRVRKNAHHMSELIEGLLDLSRINQYTVKIEKINLSVICEEIFQRLKDQQQDENTEQQNIKTLGRHVDIQVEDAIEGYADRKLVTIALENLLGNAWKYTQKLSSNAMIKFGSIKHDKKIIFYVKDNGAGFDMAHTEKLFAVFQRLHTAAEFKGTGVGLSTVQRIIHRHGGDIWAESEVNKGATFFFTLADVNPSQTG